MVGPQDQIDTFYTQLSEKLTIKKEDDTKEYVGVELTRENGKIILKQLSLINKFLNEMKTHINDMKDYRAG